MIPRARVDVLRDDETLDQVWEQMGAGHSRYPVLDRDDQVVGVVQLQDLLVTPERDGVPVTTLMRPPLLVPTTMALPDALDELMHTRNQLACVIDEYGGFAGVLTGEDLAEELVGEIDDEHDPDDDVIAVTTEDDTWLMPGDLPIDEVERTLGQELPRDDYETLAGLAIAEHGALPPAGTVLTVDLPIDPADLADSDEPEPHRLRLEVLEVERHVPSRLRVSVEEPAATEAGPDSAACDEGGAR
jgi:CBS domain containing-hemolysin-like protein